MLTHSFFLVDGLNSVSLYQNSTPAPDWVSSSSPAPFKKISSAQVTSLSKPKLAFGFFLTFDKNYVKKNT